jgi:hypothetical protein
VLVSVDFSAEDTVFELLDRELSDEGVIFYLLRAMGLETVFLLLHQLKNAHVAFDGWLAQEAIHAEEEVVLN